VEYVDLAKRLTSDAEAIFVAMVDAHIASTKGDREFLSIQLAEGSDFVWTGDSEFSHDTADQSALHDLVDHGLLRIVRHSNDGGPVYDIPGEGLEFYRALRSNGRSRSPTWSLRSGGSLTEPLSLAPMALCRGILRTALDLLWSERLDDQTVSKLGSHLRSSIIDLVNAMTGTTSEDVATNLKLALDARAQAGRIQEREVTTLLELTRACQSLNQRLTHIRDETSKGRPIRNWDELRRATYLTTVLCSELAGL
jgi:hypothetical protein